MPAFVRASALTELSAHVSPAHIALARAGLSDPDMPIGALDMLEPVPANQRWLTVSPLLSDPIRGVRIRAAALLASVPTPRQPPADQQRFERAAAEFIAAQRLNADRPEARAALGTFFAQRGRVAEAEVEYKAALRLSPQLRPQRSISLTSIAKLAATMKGAKVLWTAIQASPQDAGLHHALGLALVRAKRLDQALDEVHRAVELDPDRARHAYVYAVALHSVGRVSEAITALKDNLARHPNNRDTLTALLSLGICVKLPVQVCHRALLCAASSWFAAA